MSENQVDSTQVDKSKEETISRLYKNKLILAPMVRCVYLWPNQCDKLGNRAPTHSVSYVWRMVAILSIQKRQSLRNS